MSHDENSHVSAGAQQTGDLLGAIARGWCAPENAGKEMDSDLAFAIGREVTAHLASQSQAAQPSELTDRQIKELSNANRGPKGLLINDIAFARAIEREVTTRLAGQSQATRAVPIADLSEFTERSIREHADFREDIERLSTADSRTRKALRKEIYDTIDARVRNAVKAALAAPTAQEVTLQAAKAETAEQADRFFMDHGVWHDRVTGDHLWTQDQYDEQWRDMYKAGQEDAANGFNMLGKRNEEQTRPDDQGNAQDAQNDAGATSAGRGIGADQHHEHREGQSGHQHEHAGRDSGGARVSGAVPVQAAEELACRFRAKEKE